MIEMRRIHSTVVAEHGTYMDVMPVKDSFYAESGYGSETLKKKVNVEFESVSINSYANAYRFNGKPQTATHPMFGR